MASESELLSDVDASNSLEDDHRPLASFKFTSLSREIRDQIYTLALYSPSPIVVWKGQWQSFLNDHHDYTDTSFTDSFISFGTTWKRWIESSATKISLANCSTNLLLCNKAIGEEAARVFYETNAFAFLGDHNYDPVVSWLTKIGDRNRNHLSRLEINAYRSAHVWRRPNGQRKQANDLCTESIYPRSPYLQLRTPLRYGLVENINPAIETIFRLLGQRTSTRKLTINFTLKNEYPGEGPSARHEWSLSGRTMVQYGLAKLDREVQDPLHNAKSLLQPVRVPCGRDLDWKMPSRVRGKGLRAIQSDNDPRPSVKHQATRLAYHDITHGRRLGLGSLWGCWLQRQAYPDFCAKKKADWRSTLWRWPESLFRLFSEFLAWRWRVWARKD